jgi:hypothetical protein
MRTYEEIEFEGNSVVKATEGDKTLWIPTDPNNSDYAEYLRFQAWVDEGNDPDEFWNEGEI